MFAVHGLERAARRQREFNADRVSAQPLSLLTLSSLSSSLPPLLSAFFSENVCLDNRTATHARRRELDLPTTGAGTVLEQF